MVIESADNKDLSSFMGPPTGCPPDLYGRLGTGFSGAGEPAQWMARCYQRRHSRGRSKMAGSLALSRHSSWKRHVTAA